MTNSIDRQALIDVIAEHLSGTYHCTRTWQAWSYGTMSANDFEDVSESDTPSEIADAVLSKLAEIPPPGSKLVEAAHQALGALKALGADDGYAAAALRSALEAAPSPASTLVGAPHAAITYDLTGCEHMSCDVALIEEIAAKGSNGPTDVIYLYTGPQPSSIEQDAEIERLRVDLAVKEMEAIGYLRAVGELQARLAATTPSPSSSLEGETVTIPLAEYMALRAALTPFAKYAGDPSHIKQRAFLQLLICPMGDEHPENFVPHFQAARAALAIAKEGNRCE